MNERVFEMTMLSGARVSSPAVRYASKHAGEDTRAPLITHAVELEGDAPLYFSIEAVDE